MTACTDDERREVARRLRGLHLGGGSKDLIERTLSDAIGAWRRSGMSWDFITERLADLIEPSCDRDTPQKVAEEMFGKMRHSTKEEADVYDAMLKSKSVEIHPVDRDALLELADEMEAGPRRERCPVAPDCSECAGHCSERLSEYYARRIREALGVGQ